MRIHRSSGDDGSLSFCVIAEREADTQDLFDLLMYRIPDISPEECDTPDAWEGAWRATGRPHPLERFAVEAPDAEANFIVHELTDGSVGGATIFPAHASRVGALLDRAETAAVLRDRTEAAP